MSTPVRMLIPAATILLIVGTALQALPANAQSDEQASRFQLAETFLRAGQYDRAIALLEDLYDGDPATYVFYSRLKHAYESTKQYEKAIVLVDERIKTEDSPVLQWAEKARLQYLKGDEAGAADSWEQAIAVAPDKQNTYYAVHTSLTQVREFEQAVDVLGRARIALDDPTLFRKELGYLHGLNGEHALAIEEYMALLETDPAQLANIRSRLMRFVEEQSAVAESIAVAERYVRQNPLNMAFRQLLAWLYVEAGEYRKAFDANRAMDRLENEGGRILFDFANKASRAGSFDVAMDAYEEILSRYPTSNLAPEAQRGKAEMLERWAAQIGDHNSKTKPARLYERALSAYGEYLEKYPRSGHWPYVLLRIGVLRQDVFGEIDDAQHSYEQIVNDYPAHPAADEARFHLGQLALVRNDLDDARLIFTRLEDRLRVGELAEKARYEQARIHFFRGEFDGALALIEAMKENTSTDIANDAIELRILLLENRGPDSLDAPLRMLGRTEMLRSQRQLDKAMITIDSLIATFGAHPIADEARFVRAGLLEQTGDYEAAAVALVEIPMMFPQSYLADRSLFDAAVINQELLLKPDAALTLYNRILVEYPGSLLSSEARARVRLLRNDDV